METDESRRLVPKPQVIQKLEERLGRLVPVHPNVISTFKLLVIVPLLLLGHRGSATLDMPAWVMAGLLLAFAGLDYLDGVVARNRNLTTGFGRVWDRLTDYPILFILSWYCLDVLPVGLLAGKLALDLLLLAQYLSGMGTTENRLRTTISYTTLAALLFLGQGWAARWITPELVRWLLRINIIFSGLVVLHNARILSRRYIADLLSGLNLLCGVLSMVWAAKGRLEVSILFLLLGAACDGFDGAAARRWGGTRWGVYSDDVADGVNYGLAPAAALYFVISGLEGLVAGALYALFTIGRLVFFTLNKDSSDPEYFSGVPSTAGGIITLSALYLFPDRPVLLGLLVGAACILMVSFDTHHRHLGRALAASRRWVFGLSGLVLALLVLIVLAGPRHGIALLLVMTLGYSLVPTVLHFRKVLSRRQDTPPSRLPVI